MQNNGIRYACLRKAWSRDIYTMPDEALVKVSEILKEHSVEPVLLVTNIGACTVDKLREEAREELKAALNICSFFKCKAIRVAIGVSPASSRDKAAIEEWMHHVSGACISANVIPTVELSLNMAIAEPAELAHLLNGHKRWSIIYDPAVLIMHRRVDPYIRYWALLKQRVSHLDIHDYSIGKAPKLPGHGDAKLDLTISDAATSNFKGYYCIEPGMGRRQGSMTSKRAIFEAALESFKKLLRFTGV